MDYSPMPFLIGILIGGLILVSLAHRFHRFICYNEPMRYGECGGEWKKGDFKNDLRDLRW